MQKKKQGVSLIVLVLTIIIMIILAAAVILALNNSNIIERADNAVAKTDMAQIQELASIAWTEAYADGKKTQKELEKAVMDSLEANGITEKQLEKCDITVTTEGVTVTEPFVAVATTVDTVPIPKGFVASPYDGENTKNGGLVIYELKDSETEIPSSETHQTSLTTRNQYVWIPVDDFSKFVRQDFMNATSKVVDTSGKYYNLGSTDVYWEVEVDENNMPLSKEQTSDYIADGDLDYISEATIKEAQAMYKSVKKYGGFYVARYEAGIDTQRTKEDVGILPSNVYSMMGKIPCDYMIWGNSISDDTNGAVEAARSMYPDDSTNTTGVISTLIYGVQWDAILSWWTQIGATDTYDNVIDVTKVSGAYSNIYTNYYSSGAFNQGAKYAVSSNSIYLLDEYQDISYNSSGVSTSKKEGLNTSWVLTTGALKIANVKNIYDMSGNVAELTMEGSKQVQRVPRSGWAGNNMGMNPMSVAYRGIMWTDRYIASGYEGFRTALYIK